MVAENSSMKGAVIDSTPECVEDEENSLALPHNDGDDLVLSTSDLVASDDLSEQEGNDEILVHVGFVAKVWKEFLSFGFSYTKKVRITPIRQS